MEVMGDFLSLTRARKEKSRPSRAMAKMIRGRGNMEPSRLGGRGSVGRKTSDWDDSCGCRVGEQGERKNLRRSVGGKGEELAKGDIQLAR